MSFLLRGILSGMVFSLLVMLRFERERTPSQIVLYGLYLYFLGLSFRYVSLALDPFVRRSHMSVWKWVQRYQPHRIFDVMRVQAFLVDETYVKIGSSEAWIWVAVEPVHRYILGVYLSRHQNILVAELFLKGLVKKEVWEAYSLLGRRHMVS